MSNPRTDMHDRYITCAVKINGNENGRTEILDTHIDGGEGEPLIVASFFDRGVAYFFCKAANEAYREVLQRADEDHPNDAKSACGGTEYR